MSESSPASIPILVTGRGEQIGRLVVDMMKPEYEVIHFTLASAVAEELPLLLTGKPPSTPSSTLGSGDWSSPPCALLLGGAYHDDDIEKLVKLVEETEGASKIPWLRVDSSKLVPPSQEPSEAQAKEYGMAVSKRMKETLDRLSVGGRLGDGNGRVYLV